MANTNTNTGNTNQLSSDIYEVSGFLDQIRKDNIPDLDETAAMVGIFGYMNEMFSQTLQNTLIVTAETSNEAIPTRAKFTKNVINHAMNLSINNIYAKPAVMTLMFYLPIEFIENNFTEYNAVSGRAKFILDRNVPIFVGGFEYHFDYDVIITRIKNPQGVYVYTAMYDLFETGTTEVKQANPISDITNPYITTVVQTTLEDGIEYVGFSARLHQVSLNDVTQTVLTDNSIENKTVTFSFSDQLAAFDLDVEENGIVHHLIPVYAGLLDNTLEDGEWCYYEFLDEFTIRILFNKNSYVPALNSNITINIKRCEGSSANFTYTESFRTSLRSVKYNDYSGMYAIVYPLLNGVSTGGKDKKSIEDLRRIIPREASSRGAIINTTDLQNFFNSIDDYNAKLYFKKRRDNQFERMYYAYLLMRKDGYVYPTNTLNLKLDQSDFKGFAGNNNLVLSPGTVFYYYDHGSAVENDFATVVPPTFVEGLDPDYYPHPMTENEDGELVRVFEYISPYLITIDDDLISSYLMTIMNENKTFQFVSINTTSDLQFIATNMNWNRKFISTTNPDDRYDYKYNMTVDILQNNSSDYNLVKFHKNDEGEKVFDDVRMRVIMVLYTDDKDNVPYRYTEAEIIDYIPEKSLYTFKFTMGTDDVMDLNNRINITGVYNAKPEEFQHIDTIATSHGYMNKNTYAKIFIMADFGTKAGDIVDNITVTAETEQIILYGEDGIGNRSEIESIVPTRNDIVDSFLNNDIYITKDGNQVNVITIMRGNPDYMHEVMEYNGNEQQTEIAILRYLRNNKDSDFVQNTLLQDEDVIEVIDSYNYLDLSRYTVCNTMAVNDGLDFYHDYSSMMRSTVTVKQVQQVDANGNPVYEEIARTDAYGNSYIEYKPVYVRNGDNGYFYNYTMARVPMVMNGFFNTEDSMQDYIADLDERRKYINECLYVLEDTFDIDLKFFNTYGPSRMFYYNIPSSQDYKVKVAIRELKVLSNTSDEDNPEYLVTVLPYGTQVHITKVKGQWGYFENTINGNLVQGWIKLADTTKVINYIDNVALKFKWALEAETSADKYITTSIITDIKEYIEDINEVNELHIPNIITLITNNYREQLVYFEFLDVNGYGASCQHLYLEEKIDADITPEFLNIETSVDGTETPLIDIAVY